MSQREHNIAFKIVIRLGSDQPAQVILITLGLLHVSIDNTCVTNFLEYPRTQDFETDPQQKVGHKILY